MIENLFYICDAMIGREQSYADTKATVTHVATVFFVLKTYEFYYVKSFQQNKTMSRGKRICEILKTVRKQIADANGIFYEPRVCTYKGDCQGTCPVCDFEVRYLERELSACRKAGGTVKIAGIVSVMSLVSCGGDMTSNNIVSNNGIQQGVEAECSEDTMSVGVDVAEKENGKE